MGTSPEVRCPARRDPVRCVSLPAGLAALLLGLAAQAQGELLITPGSTWAVPSSVPAGQLVQYELCDEAGEACSPIGIGRSDLAGAPYQLTRTCSTACRLRSRLCQRPPEAGEEPVLCGPPTAAGPVFIPRAGLQAGEIISVDLVGMPSAMANTE